MSALVSGLAQNNVRLQVMEHGFSCLVCRNRFLLGVESAKVLLPLVPLNMSDPLVSGCAPRNSRVAGLVVRLYGFVLHVLGLICQPKVLNPVIVSNAIDVVQCDFRRAPVMEKPNKPMFPNMEAANTSVSVALDIGPKSVSNLFLLSGLDEVESSVSVREVLKSGFNYMVDVVGFWGFGRVSGHGDSLMCTERIHANINDLGGQRV